MNIDEYNKMGTSASSGSIYMTPADAKWIYNNCGVNTQVQIENDFDIPSSVNITEFKNITMLINSKNKYEYHIICLNIKMNYMILFCDNF